MRLWLNLHYLSGVQEDRVPWTARRSNHLILKKSILNIQWKDWCWRWSSNILATWCKDLTHWKRPFWERLRQEEKGVIGWDGWMVSLTQWIWIWANSQGWWRTGKFSMLQSMGSQRVGQDWAAEQQQEDRSGRSWGRHVLSCILFSSIWFYFATAKSFNNCTATDCQVLLTTMRSLSIVEWQVVFIQSITLDQLPGTTPHAFVLSRSEFFGRTIQ